MRRFGVKKGLLAGILVLLLCGLSACVSIHGKGELYLNADGTGSRSIMIAIPKKDDHDGNGVAYYYIRKHGKELEAYIQSVYAANAPGSDSWLTVQVTDQDTEAELIELRFEFDSFEQYAERFRKLVYDETYAVNYKDPVLEVDEEGRPIFYRESSENMMAIMRCLQNTIMEDKEMFDFSCTKDGKALNTSASMDTLRQHGIAKLQDAADERLRLMVEEAAGIKEFGLAASGAEYTWYREGYEPDRPALSVAMADEWTALFRRYNQTEITWTGADGIYTAALDGNDAFASAGADTKTFFVFSDTWMGTSDESGGGLISAMPNHTSALLDGNTADASKIQFIWGEGGSMSLKGNQNLFGKKKWLTDCLVLDDMIYVFGFTPIGLDPYATDLFSIPIRDGEPVYEEYSMVESIPQLYYRDDDKHIMFSYGVHVNTAEAGAPDPDGYIYIYGRLDDVNNYSQYMVASRIAAEDFPDFTKLAYWDGTDWSPEITACRGLVPGVSAEFSVTPITVGPYAGKYMAVYMKDDVSGKIMYALGDSPVGPFEPPVQIYMTPEQDVAVKDRYGAPDSMVTYNAKAHPHLSYGDKLLLSYNVNVYNGSNTPYTYHPRFLWLDLDPENEPEPSPMPTPTPIPTLTPTPTVTPIPTPAQTTETVTASETTQAMTQTSGEQPAPTNVPAQIKPGGNHYLLWTAAAVILLVCGAAGFVFAKRRKRGKKEDR